MQAELSLYGLIRLLKSGQYEINTNSVCVLTDFW